LKVRAQSYQNNAKDENSEAGDQGQADKALGAPNAIDEKWPDEIELLFDLKRPKVVDVEVVKDERVPPVTEGEICGVGKEKVLPARPDKVKRPCKKKECDEHAIVKREDAERPANIEGFEEVRFTERIQKDARDEKAGENEEEINPNIRGQEDMVHQVEKP
jgi:hypothetical protein